MYLFSKRLLNAKKNIFFYLHLFVFAFSQKKSHPIFYQIELSVEFTFNNPKKI